ncbi:MAG: hypothetical protein QM762_14395 [Chryseolinea sp.]
MDKQFSGGIRRAIDNVFVGYKSMDYPESIFKMDQTRAIVSRAFSKYFFSVDAGATFNQIITTYEHGVLTQDDVSGTLGLTKVIGAFKSRFLSGWGFQANINYHPNRTMYEVATFRGFGGRKIPYTTFMARYYNYEEVDGWMLSLRFSLFSSEYYCCYSYYAHTAQIASIR